MNRYKLPVLLPPGVTAIMTQPYGLTANAIEPVGPNGEPHFHYGIDLVFGDSAHTYGTPIVSPFAEAEMTAYTSPPGTYTQTPYIQLSGVGASGNHYELVLAHCGAIFFANKYIEGTIVGSVGNYGMVVPQPTPGNPFAGSHLHLGVKEDGKWIDPQLVFDITQSYIGPPHDFNLDVPRLQWALEQLMLQFKALTSAK